MTTLVLTVYGLAFFLDYADTRHKLAVEARAPAAAAWWSVVMYLLGLFATWAALDVSPWLALPTCAGLATGSAVAIYRAKQEEYPDGS